MSIICENCGKPLDNNTDVVISVKNGECIHIFCKECNQAFGHCPMCQHNTTCGFFNDPDPSPLFVIKTYQNRTPNGIQIIQRQVPNEARVRKFCLDGKCKCYNGDDKRPLCCRHGGCATCTNYTELERYKFGQDFSMLEVNEN